MAHTLITTQHDQHIINALERMAVEQNSSKEAILESLAQQAAKAYEAFERDVQAGIEALENGQFITNEQLLEELHGLGVSV